MNWRSTSPHSVESEDGRYSITGRYDGKRGYLYEGCVVGGEMVAASHDREFVQGRCEAHANRNVSREAEVEAGR